MWTASLVFRRSTSQAGLLSTVGAVSLVLTALVVGLFGYLDFSATINTRHFIADATPTASSLRVETKLGSDPAAQSATADTFFAHTFAGIPVHIDRTLIDFPLSAARDGKQLALDDGNEARITPWSDASLADFAKLVAGAWPTASSSTGPVQGALQADAAKRLGISVGDVLSVGTGSEAKAVEIVATWLPKNPLDQHWFADPGVATGTAIPAGDGTASFGPLVIDEAAIATFGPVPYVHWTIAVDANTVTPAELDRLGTIATTLRQSIIDDGKFGTGDVLVEGTIAQSATTVQRNLESVRGVTPVGILLVALIGLIALVQLARLLSLARRPENALLRSRGASAQWLTTAGLIEAAAVSALGCTAGFAAAAGALLALFGPAAVPFAPWEFAVLIGIAVLVIFGLTAFLDSIRLAKRDAIDDSGRTQAAATIGTAVLALAAAGVAVWQSLLYGSPLITDAAGRTSVNPLAVVAPTLSLIAIALILLVVFGPLASTWQRMAAARPRLQPSYSARQVARGLSSYAVAVLVVALAVGGVVIASGYSGSWHSLTQRNAELVTGADAKVILTSSAFPQADATPVTGAEFLDLPGVTAAAPVLSTTISIGDNDDGQLTAIPHDQIEKIVTHAGGSLDPATLARGVGDAKVKGIEFPQDATALSLTMTVRQGFDSETSSHIPNNGWVQGVVWLRNSAGAVITMKLPQIDIAPLTSEDSVVKTVRLDLPPSSDPWRLVAIDYYVSAYQGFLNTTFSDLEVTTASGPQHVALDTRSWGMPLLFSFGSSTISAADGLTLGMPGDQGRPNSLRYAEQGVDPNSSVPQGVGVNTYFESAPLPLVVSKELATHYDVGPGDPFTLRFAGTGLSINGKIAAVATLLPGVQSRYAIVVDLNALTEYIIGSSNVVPRANQVWLATSGPASFGSVLPDGATVVTANDAIDSTFAAPAELALWIAALGCLLLAAISLGAVALTVARARRGEVAVLRAVGISARQQSRSRFVELAAVILVSVVFGVLGGVAVSALTLPNLAHSAVQSVPEGLPATLSFALALGGTLLAGSLLVMLGIAWFSAARVRRQALDTSERLETR